MYIETLVGPSLSVGAGALFLADMKDHLRVDHSDTDAEIHGLIQAATRWIEAEADLHILERTSAIWLNEWRGEPNQNAPWWDGARDGPVSLLDGDTRRIALPLRPLLSVEAVDTFDQDGTVHNLDARAFHAQKGLEPFLVRMGAAWPRPGRVADGIRITVRSGFGDTPNTVPADIGQAIKIAAAHLFTHKGDDGDANLPAAAMRLIAPYKRRRL